MAEGREPLVFSPKTLYELSVPAVAENFFICKKYLSDIPKVICFDLYYQLYKEKRLCLLRMELSNFETFANMLTVTSRRVHLFQIYQSLMDHGVGIEDVLVANYKICCLCITTNSPAQENVINLGLMIGGFLSDAGWYLKSAQVLSACIQLCKENNNTSKDWCRTLECYRNLLHVQAVYCSFSEAAHTYQCAVELVEQLKDAGYSDWNYAALYTEFSVLFYMKSEYDQAYRWSIKALKQLKPTLPARVTIDVLRQAAKSCVLKREFKKAGLLIRQALYLARKEFDVNHPVYSNVLTDYGFYFLHYDSIVNSVTVYKTALDIKKEVFGKMNLHVALAHEDLAYALYVYEYASGKFQEASDHVGKAIVIMKKLLRGEHLLLASAKRVKALILEEIALDSASTPLSEQCLLFKAECLHLSALKLTKKAFGEMNIQTAKHYGNLGRLYQSMRKFEAAEAMHVKAIDIKEVLLGPDDYELGLSLEHLASLYNFQMNRYRDAEKLYHRSLAICLKMFGKSYSGLEYDYRGLIRVYTKLNEYDKVLEYETMLNDWKVLRDEHAQLEDLPIDLERCPEPIGNVINTFFSM